jgi:hypothetical protein
MFKALEIMVAGDKIIAAAIVLVGAAILFGVNLGQSRKQ